MTNNQPNKIIEDTVEQVFIQDLQDQGYDRYLAADIAPGAENAMRENNKEVVLKPVLSQKLRELNPTVPESVLSEVVSKVCKLDAEKLEESNQAMHEMMVKGVKEEYMKLGEVVTETVKLVDWENVEANSYVVTNQFAVKGENEGKRPDVVVFLNGLPVVVAELKNPVDEHADLERAYNQIQTYKRVIPQLFVYNVLCIISDGQEGKVSSYTAPFSRFLKWRSDVDMDNTTKLELSIMTEKMLNKEALLKLIRDYTVYEGSQNKDSKTGITTTTTIKKVAAYHQYYAVQKSLDRTIVAINAEDESKGKIGVVWHTQGSGKSLSMVFYAGQVMRSVEMGNPTIVIVTDRNDLDDQLYNTFSSCHSVLGEKPKQVSKRDDLKDMLKVAGGGIVFTTIQKFDPEQGNVFETLSERDNIVVIADEAHRTQYGFEGRVVETKDGAETKYGFAKYLRDALPNASFIGFTGTPIEFEDKSTKEVFGEYIDIYDIKQSVADNATVQIDYEPRLIKIKVQESVLRSMDNKIDSIEGATEEQIENAKKVGSGIDGLLGTPERIEDVVNDIIPHFLERKSMFDGKAMIVCNSRLIANNMYDSIIAKKPGWHSDDITKGRIKVITTSSSDDAEALQKYSTTKQQKRELANRFRDDKDELDIVIVCDMWLTGFDAPSVNTMYIDKRMKGAKLMQAIARVNRVYKDKPSGLIVDYVGIGQDLRKGIETYTKSGGKGTPIGTFEQLIDKMLEKYEVVCNLLHRVEYEEYFSSDNAKTRLEVLMRVQNFILDKDNMVNDAELKKVFVDNVTALSRAYAAVVTSEEAVKIRGEVAFFQALKARVAKVSMSSGMSNQSVNTAVKQIVDEALNTEGVVDILDMINSDKDRMDILSEEFLMEVKGMKEKNVAIELLKNLLKDEIKARGRVNIQQNKKFSEMLTKAIDRYNAGQIDSLEVIQELINIAEELKQEDGKIKKLGLTEEEYAFYSMLASSKSMKHLEDNKLKQLVQLITKAIQTNATVDWTHRSDVRAQLKLDVKRLLKKYGYPPEIIEEESTRVLEQSEVLAARITE